MPVRSGRTSPRFVYTRKLKPLMRETVLMVKITWKATGKARRCGDKYARPSMGKSGLRLRPVVSEKACNPSWSIYCRCPWVSQLKSSREDYRERKPEKPVLHRRGTRALLFFIISRVIWSAGRSLSSPPLLAEKNHEAYAQ